MESEKDRLIRSVMGRLRTLQAGIRGMELQVDRHWERYAEMGKDEIRENMTKHDAFERYDSARQALNDHHAYIAQAMADARALGVKFDPLTGVPEFPPAAIDTSAMK